MMLVGVGILTLVTATTLMFLRCVVEREIRWNMYALRDQLRSRAIDDEAFAQSPLFEKLDRSITADCRHLEDVSVWMALPFLVSSSARRVVSEHAAELDAQLRAPENQAFVPFFAQSRALLAKHLLYRHLGALLLAVPTLVGIVVVIYVTRRLAAAMVAGDIMPRPMAASA